MLFLCCLSGSAPALAAGSAGPEAKLGEREIYERELIQRALDRLGLVPEPHPEGKRIARVEVVRFPIVEPSDPWPQFVNIFHVVTREHIVRQELLFSAGQTYDESLVRESARNLRAMPLLFSTVRIVTARGPTKDSVVVVVITKDLWSIRLNSNINFGGGTLNYFYATPSEQNFLGYNQQLSLHYALDRDVQAFGQVYRVPRLFGSRLQLSENLAMRVNHHSGRVEGGWGSLLVQRPLFSLESRWGYWAQAAFDLGIQRAYQGDSYQRVWLADGDLQVGVPWIYGYQRYSLDAGLVRSFGSRYKTDLSVGYQLRSYSYRVDGSINPDFGLLSERGRQAFRQSWLPVDDQAGAVTGGVSFYQARYARLQNVQTLGLTEDFRLGPSASFSLIWANQAFGFSQSSLRFDASLGYRLQLGQDLLSLSLSAGARYFPDHQLADVSADWVDQLYDLQLENISPSLWGLGRLLVRFHYAYLLHSRARSLFSLGGDTTLRGFPSGFAAGPRLLNINLEFRSVPWVIYTMHLGFVVFYDAGDAYGYAPDDDFGYHHSVGVGLRWLIPQLDRATMRFDLGIPLGADFHTRVLQWFSIAFLQAF